MMTNKKQNNIRKDHPPLSWRGKTTSHDEQKTQKGQDQQARDSLISVKMSPRTVVVVAVVVGAGRR